MQLQEENDKLKAKPSSTGAAAVRPSVKQLTQKELNAIAEENKKRNQKMIEEITKQKYSKLDAFTYYKILQKVSQLVM